LTFIHRESQEWLLPGVKERMFHLTAEECCEKVYKNSACKQYPEYVDF